MTRDSIIALRVDGPAPGLGDEWAVAIKAGHDLTSSKLTLLSGRHHGKSVASTVTVDGGDCTVPVSKNREYAADADGRISSPAIGQLCNQV